AVGGADERGVGLLELLYGGAADEIARGQEGLPAVVQLGADLRVLGGQVNQRDSHVRATSLYGTGLSVDIAPTWSWTGEEHRRQHWRSCPHHMARSGLYGSGRHNCRRAFREPVPRRVARRYRVAHGPGEAGHGPMVVLSGAHT